MVEHLFSTRIESLARNIFNDVGDVVGAGLQVLYKERKIGLLDVGQSGDGELQFDAGVADCRIENFTAKCCNRPFDPTRGIVQHSRPVFQSLCEIGNGPKTDRGLGEFGANRNPLQKIFVSFPCVVIEIEVG